MRTEHRKYSTEDDTFIRANYRTMSNRELGARLGHSEKSIADRLGRQLGLRRWITVPFTEAEDQVIRSGKGRTIRSIAKELGRAPAVISSRARRLGISSWMEYAGLYKEYGEYRVVRSRHGKRIPEHRIVMAKALGRELADTERVHHINCKKRDNRKSNLHLFTNNSAHSRAHHSINGLVAELLERGVIRFDRTEGVYKLCEILK